MTYMCRCIYILLVSQFRWFVSMLRDLFEEPLRWLDVQNNGLL